VREAVHVECMKAPSEEIYDKSTQGTLKSTFGGLQRCRWKYGSILCRSRTYTARDTVIFVSHTPKFWFQKSVDDRGL